jgi:hypothetical protein
MLAHVTELALRGEFAALSGLEVTGPRLFPAPAGRPAHRPAPRGLPARARLLATDPEHRRSHSLAHLRAHSREDLMSRPATDRLKFNAQLGTPPILQFVAPTSCTSIRPISARSTPTRARR